MIVQRNAGVESTKHSALLKKIDAERKSKKDRYNSG